MLTRRILIEMAKDTTLLRFVFERFVSPELAINSPADMDKRVQLVI